MVELQESREVIPKYYSRFWRAVAIQCAIALTGAIGFIYCLHRSEYGLEHSPLDVVGLPFIMIALLFPILDLFALYRLSVIRQLPKVDAELPAAEVKLSFWDVKGFWREMKSKNPLCSPDLWAKQTYGGSFLWFVILGRVTIVTAMFFLIAFDFFCRRQLPWDIDVVCSLVFLVASTIALPTCYVYALVRFARQAS